MVHPRAIKAESKTAFSRNQARQQVDLPAKSVLTRPVMSNKFTIQVIIGKDGNIRHRSFGFRGETELLDELDAIISILNS